MNMTTALEIKEMIDLAHKAQVEFERNYDQQQVDLLTKLSGKVIYDHSEQLAQMAVEETAMGVVADKIMKIKNKSKNIWYDLKNKQSMGIVNIDEVSGRIDIAKPMGVVAGITPVTNPVVTAMSKIMFSLKTKNAIIISPHPDAQKTTTYVVHLINDMLAKFNVPSGLIQVIEEPSIEKTNILMAQCDVVVATGGMPMVKAAYSSGKPSFGVGAGNVQVILDRYIDYDAAAKKIINGRTFDNGIICAAEQSVIYPYEDKDKVLAAFKNNGALIVSEENRDKIVNEIFKNNKLDRDIVGKSAAYIAKKAGLNIPADTRVLVIEAHGYGHNDIICKEKMCPVLCFIPYDSFDDAIHITKSNLAVEGNGHTVGIHSSQQQNILKVGFEITTSRIIINETCATTAGGTIQNGLAVTNTLGCGSWGNNSLSGNFSYNCLLNITRLARVSQKINIPCDEEIWE